MSVNVRNGTPIHGPSPCESCANSHIERGFSESQEAVFCEVTWPSHRVRFRVHQCSAYVEKKRLSLKQMQEMAGELWALCAQVE